MVAETCRGNWMKDAIVCSGKCRFGRFLGKILVALKKIFFSTIFPDFRHIQHRNPVYVYYIYLGIHARSLKKNWNLWIILLVNIPQSTTCMYCSVYCNLKNK